MAQEVGALKDAAQADQPAKRGRPYKDGPATTPQHESEGC